MYVIVDREKCTGIGICESLDPDRFEINDDGELEVINDAVDPGEVAALEEIVQACPTGALRLASQR
jgi:ferredoxin